MCGAAAIAAGSVADVLLKVGPAVAGCLLVHELVGGARRRHPDERWQHVVAHAHPGARVLGDVAVGCDNHRDRLTDVVHGLLGQGVAGDGMLDAGVRQQHGQRLGGLPDVTKVLPRPHRDDALDVQGTLDIDVCDAGVRVRAAHERRREGALAEIVQVAALSAHEPRIFAALRGSRRCGCS